MSIPRPIPPGFLKSIVWVFAALPAFAESAAESPALFLPEGTHITMRLPDIPRTLKRYDSSPYTALLKCEWAKGLDPHPLRWDNDEPVELRPLVASLQEWAAGVVMRDEGDHFVWSLASRDATQDVEKFLSRGMTREDEKGGQALPRWRSADGLLVKHGPCYIHLPPTLIEGYGNGTEKVLSHPQGAPSDNCFELKVTRELAGEAVSKAGGLPLAAVKQMVGDAEGLFAAKLTPLGLQETWSARIPPGDRAELRRLRAPSADAAVLKGLSRSTLWALTGRFDPAYTRFWLTRGFLSGAFDGWKVFDRPLRKYGLPATLELAGSLEGDLLAYAEDVEGMPRFTLLVPFPEKTTDQIVGVLGRETDLKECADGCKTCVVAGCPFHIAKFEKRLFISTHPRGLQAYRARESGFLEHAETRSALDSIPLKSPESVPIFGVSRSGAWWSSVVDSWMRLFGQGSGADAQAVQADLQRILRYGYVYVQSKEDGYQVRGEGVAGGPFVTSLSGLLLSAMIVIERRVKDGPAEQITVWDMIKDGSLFDNPF